MLRNKGKCTLCWDCQQVDYIRDLVPQLTGMTIVRKLRGEDESVHTISLKKFFFLFNLYTRDWQPNIGMFAHTKTNTINLPGYIFKSLFVLS